MKRLRRFIDQEGFHLKNLYEMFGLTVRLF